MKTIDSVVVGGGVGGLAAALFLGRAGRSTSVFDGGQSTILSVDIVREYLGFDGVSPTEMLQKARDEVIRYGVELREELVTDILPLKNGNFEVVYPSGRITTRTVVLATGETYELPNISGIPEKWGRDLKVCPCFDGNEVKDGAFVVFGIPDKLAHMALWVSMWSANVTIVSRHNFNEEESERLNLLGIKIVKDDVAGLDHEGQQLTGVITEKGAQIPCDATWVALASRATSPLAAALCEVDANGFAVADASGATSYPGVYAIGNATQPWDHLAHAAAAGTRVGPIVTNYLLEQKISELRIKKHSQR
ncbi:NAD(P)/FAD-dependent oxidoreductase [Psychrobacter aquaticus]|uniref:FAD/NAD(P)-binding domain-containing protein n=1 Tax=Psychrobacter aquaticus CMS 56 TaxID=1354303 RepID=U4T4H7_9GAMM|nr:NAD(P)/FAD-dependent oxidoreductase [Psychrobacter aquaticus]ERL56272.1 hypothetical protein M917_0950 [Psychrobacter aquaticus CMS 56]